jgi:hypothetical protein
LAVFREKGLKVKKNDLLKSLPKFKGFRKETGGKYYVCLAKKRFV